jgi:O-antigen/teichoic acid export membrane protein
LKIKKSILALFGIKAASILISLVMVPLTIHYLSPVKYGVWLTLSSIVGWIGYFDIGFGNGLRNRFAESVAKKNYQLARTYVSTTYALLTIIMGSFLFVFLIINPFLNWAKILNAPFDMHNELTIVAFITIAFFCFQIILQLVSIILSANLQPARASLIPFVGSVVSFIAIFLLTRFSHGNLILLSISLSLSPLGAYFFASIWLFSKEYREFLPSIRFVKFSLTKDLLGLGVKFFILQVAFLFLFQSSNVIIAQLFGPEEVTSYNVAYKYFSVIPMINLIIIMPLWSAITDAWVKKDYDWIKNTYYKLKLVWLFLGFLSGVMLLFSGFIYKLWVGDIISVPLRTSLALSVLVVVMVGNGIFAVFFNGIGKITLQVWLSIFAMVLFIPVAVFMGRNHGVLGVITPMILLNAVILFIQAVQYSKIIRFRASGIWFK